MGFSFDISVPVLTVFAQGLLSFLSPCVLPLLPLYLSYLAGGGKQIGEDGRVHYPRKQVFINTLFFTIGIGFTFFLLGFGFTALGKFFNSNRTMFARISGIIMVMFGLYQFGFFGSSKIMGKERRMFLKLDRWTMGPFPALLLGFTFSFAWTPCVGPVLSSVMLMAGTTSSMGKAAMLIGVYTLGFTLPFLAVGLFTSTMLEFFKKHGSVVKYTVKAGALLLILMGIMTFTGFMNSFTGYLSNPGSFSGGNNSQSATNQTTAAPPETSPAIPDSGQEKSAETDNTEASKDNASQTAAGTDNATAESTTEAPKILAPDFTLVDQYGDTHTLSDYQGKTVFLNFWATWCPPCRGEMPEIQALYEKYGSNKEDLIVLGVAGPNQGQEGDTDHIKDFLTQEGYTFPVVMDETGAAFMDYSIYSYPTTFMIDTEGNVFGYASGALSADMMESIVKQTMSGKLEPQE